MAVIYNDNHFYEIFVPKLKEAINYVLENITEENIKAIDAMIYTSNSPDVYNRTYEFREAWDKTTASSGNTATGSFFYEPSKMSINPEDGQHASLVTGEDFREYLADVIYNGFNDKLFGGGWWSNGRNAFKVLQQWLTNSQFRQLFEEGMTKAGIPWSKSVGAVQREAIK